uniref:Putative metalloprotease n=1 Tax=Ixodes ricinus TaxID=34613 RepID=A0A0K8REN7_IXORI
MNALKLQELLLLLLFASVSAEVKDGAHIENAACNQPESDEKITVGLFFLTDKSFMDCTAYKNNGILNDYLSAFTGAVGMRFKDINSPTVDVVYTGFRPLTESEEQEIIGRQESHNSAIKGVDALLRITDIAINEDAMDSNKMYYVLTWLNITEEKTKPLVNENLPISDSSSSSDSDETHSELLARSAYSKKSPQYVGGLTRFGVLCSLGAGAIGQDDGKSFSGVETAAIQVATALGKMYNGSIARRICSEDEDGSEFHREECYAVNTKANDELDCLKESMDAANSSVRTPSEFFYKVQPVDSLRCILRRL